MKRKRSDLIRREDCCRNCRQNVPNPEDKVAEELSMNRLGNWLEAGDEVSPIWREIVGEVLSIHTHAGDGDDLEVFFEVTENGPKVVGNLLHDRMNIDGDMYPSRRTIDAELARKCRRSRRKIADIPWEIRRRFDTKDDANPFIFWVEDWRGNVHEVMVKMTRYGMRTV